LYGEFWRKELNVGRVRSQRKKHSPQKQNIVKRNIDWRRFKQ